MLRATERPFVRVAVALRLATLPAADFPRVEGAESDLEFVCSRGQKCSVCWIRLHFRWRSRTFATFSTACCWR